MNIYEKEEELFARWKKETEGRLEGEFVPDGVVCETSYSQSKLKIAFILKEVNDPGGGGWDLRKFLRDGAKDGAGTWNNAARWVHGIRNQNPAQDSSFYRENINCEFRADALKSICAINLKKTPGGGDTSLKELKSSVDKDKDFIKEQYEIYNPDLTICGGTDELFRDAVGHTAEVNLTKRGVQWYERKKGKYVVYGYHPAAQIQIELLLYQLIDAVNEIMSHKTH